jgi:hypothetical protein
MPGEAIVCAYSIMEMVPLGHDDAARRDTTDTIAGGSLILQLTRCLQRWGGAVCNIITLVYTAIGKGAAALQSHWTCTVTGQW